MTFEQTLDDLLGRKRALTTDMLNDTGDVEINEFAVYLTPAQFSPKMEELHHDL